MSAEVRAIRRRRGERLDAVVAGGGMAGAAAALALARDGFEVALVEAREPKPWIATDEVDLRVVALAPSSAQLLDALGAWHAIAAARIGPYSGMRVWDAGSSGELAFDASDLDRRELGWIVENRLVQWTLWQALEPAGVRVLCPAAVEGFEDRGEDVRIALDDGRTLDAALLVAADGAASPLRERAGIEVRGHAYAQRGVVAHVRTERPHRSLAWQRFLAGGPVALLPLADGRCSIVWSLPEAEARRVLELDDAAFLDTLGVATDFRLGRILEATPRVAFPLRLQLAQRYQSGRMVLLGDAAHVVHPLAGQGINLGLRDVGELRAVLNAARAAGHDPGAEHVLRGYARRRRSADTLDARAFDALARAFGDGPEPWPMLRGLGMRAIDRVGPLKRALARHAAGL